MSLTDADRSLVARIIAGAEEDDHGCWRWRRGLTNGYGALKINGAVHYAHRLMATIARGSLAPGQIVHHRPTCPRDCVRPSHLEPMTRGEHNSLHARLRAAQRGES